MFQDTQPAPLGDMLGDGLDEFRVSVSSEVHALLKELMDKAVVVHLSSPDGSAFGSTLWTIDQHLKRLSFSADNVGPQLQALVDAGEATAVCYLDNIKLQFDLNSLVLVRGARSAALQTALPTVLYRFQRRNSFRVRTLPRSSPTVQVRHPALPDMRIAMRVLDVSIGGCALFMADDVPTLQPGTRIGKVHVDLDADTRFEATLQVQHVTSINAASGGARLGCALFDMDGHAQRALQRYIDQTQKRRRLLSLD